jgi:putative tricarboxylic transport membrane protein
MKRAIPLISILALSAVAVSLPQTTYAAAFPDKAVTFIVPFGPGGGFDRLARALAERMAKELGVPVAIKNSPGAGGRRGSIRLFKSKPDGYTVGFGHFVPFLADENLRDKKPAIAYKKFAVVYGVSQGRHFLYVNKKSSFKTLADLKNAGRAIKFAATGIGSIVWIEAGAVGGALGFPVKFVTGYKKLPAAALAVAKGDAEASFGSSDHFRAVADDLRPLVVLSSERDPVYPNVPSALELGYPTLTSLGSLRVVSAPPGTPEDRLAVLRAAIKKAVADPTFVVWAKKSGYNLNPMEPEKFWQSLATVAKIYSSLKPMITKATGK